MAYIHNAILVIKINKVKQNKPGTERQKPHNFMYVESKKTEAFK
jgi:hypothetical protein